MADKVEIIEGKGRPTTIRITGESLRRVGAKRQTIDPESGAVISESPIEDLNPGPDPYSRSKKVEINNLIREKINSMPDKQRLQAYGEVGSALNINADNLQDLTKRINARLSSGTFKETKTLAGQMGLNLDKFKDKKNELVDDQGNVMGYRKGMATEKELSSGPLNTDEQQKRLKAKIVNERRVKELTDEINHDLDLEEIAKLKAENPDEGIFGFVKNMFNKQSTPDTGGVMGFLKAMTGTPAANAQDVNKVEVPETGDTVSFPKQIGKYKIREV